MGAGVEISHTRLFGCVEVVKRGAVSTLQDAEVVGPAQGHQQKQLTGARRQCRDPGGEQRLQSAAQRQRWGQRLQRGTASADPHRRQLQKRKRVASRLEKDPCADASAKGRKMCEHKLPGRMVIEWLQFEFGQPSAVEEAFLAYP